LLREKRRAFQRIELMPHSRMDAASPDKNVRLLQLMQYGLTISEVNSYLAVALLKSGRP
jgi:hypothetical protein